MTGREDTPGGKARVTARYTLFQGSRARSGIYTPVDGLGQGAQINVPASLCGLRAISRPPGGAVFSCLTVTHQ